MGVGKLEDRAREIAVEIDSESRRLAEANKNFKKSERGIREYLYRSEEDHKNYGRIQDMVEKMQQQVKMYKKQLEEAEDIAANNLSKFRLVYQALGEASSRAEETEQELERSKQKERAASVAKEFKY